ncbi:NlpC/P60 family protein [Streptomyces sp. NPDC127084]|uniref:NlpC/P60 family protein n=1 Tax=Streptomyces sp. NPDC127084 TaxID=3347133 RepID=UPI003658A813
MSLSKFEPSRRTALATLAAVAAGGALPLAAAPKATAAPAAPTPALIPQAAPTGSPAPMPDPRLPMGLDSTDAWHFTPHRAGPLTTRAIPGGLEVVDTRGVLATLTTGARTVTVRGPKRWFTEQKKQVEDAFDRTPPNGGWGTSPGGGTWSTTSDDTVAADYFLKDGRAVIKLTKPGESRHATLPDKNIGDVHAAARFSFDKVPTGGAVSLALTFSLSSLTNHYRARLIVTPAGEVQLVLEKALADTVTVLSAPVTVGTGFAAYDHWWVRVEKAGPLLRARAWRHTTKGVDDEPTDTWHHSVYDPEADPDKVHGAGTVGVRAHAASSATAGIEARTYDFRIDSATWVDPPVITHDTWVRVLPDPFDGTWTPALEQRISAWAGDTSPDALAYASMYRPFAPALTDPARQGAQVLGEAGYSKPAATGLCYTGADFHEYMGIGWTFPGSAEPVAPEDHFKGQLDCSGFVRMVYGYHLGIPLALYAKLDGTNLPRESKDLAAKGPGVKIADGGVGQVPSLDGLRIGDTVFFDTDEASDEGGHIGIHMGTDQHGKLRFVSSRKTPNGPTIADVGGKSILDGTRKTAESNGDLYTNTLRVIRRF